MQLDRILGPPQLVYLASPCLPRIYTQGKRHTNIQITKSTAITEIAEPSGCSLFYRTLPASISSGPAVATFALQRRSIWNNINTTIIPHPKKLHTEIASVLIPLATFAGGLTLATHFIVQCSGSRLEALLQMAAQLFLTSPIVLLAVYVFLYRKADAEAGGESLGYIQHGAVVSHFLTAGVMIAAAFLLFGVHPVGGAGGIEGYWGMESLFARSWDDCCVDQRSACYGAALAQMVIAESLDKAREG
jgi:hypothetical protein